MHKILRVKINSHRQEVFNITTTFFEENGQLYVRKAGTPEYIQEFLENYYLLDKLINPNILKLTPIINHGVNFITFKYIQGVLLFDSIQNASTKLEQNELKTKYINIIHHAFLENSTQNLASTNLNHHNPIRSFIEKIPLSSTKNVPMALLDLTWKNIVIGINQQFYFIDPEWSIPTQVDPNYIIYRNTKLHDTLDSLNNNFKNHPNLIYFEKCFQDTQNYIAPYSFSFKSNREIKSLKFFEQNSNFLSAKIKINEITTQESHNNEIKEIKLKVSKEIDLIKLTCSKEIDLINRTNNEEKQRYVKEKHEMLEVIQHHNNLEKLWPVKLGINLYHFINNNAKLYFSLVRPLKFIVRNARCIIQRNHFDKYKKSWIKQTITNEENVHLTKICLFASFDANSSIKKYVIQYLKVLKDNQFKIYFITTSPKLNNSCIEKILPHCYKIIHRENYGLDFGSWVTGLKILSKADLQQAPSLMFANDSIIGTDLNEIKNISHIFSSMDESIQNGKIDFYGLTDSYDTHHHLQSYFLVFSNRMINSSHWHDFWQQFRFYKDKFLIIQLYEIGLTAYFSKHNYKFKAFYPIQDIYDKGNYPLNIRCYNPTIHFWQELHELMDFPFVKKELIFNPKLVEFKKAKDDFFNDILNRQYIS